MVGVSLSFGIKPPHLKTSPVLAMWATRKTYNYYLSNLNLHPKPNRLLANDVRFRRGLKTTILYYK